MPDDPDGSDRFTLPDETFELRDGRQPGWFWADNALFDAHPELPATAKLVYLALCRRASHGGTAFPSHRRLALDTGLSISTVQRAIKTLQDARLTHVASGRAAGAVNHYTVATARTSQPETPPPVEVGHSDRGVGQADRGGRSPRPRGVGQGDRQKDDSSEGRLREGQKNEGAERLSTAPSPESAPPPGGHRNGHAYRQDALTVLAFLNTRAGKHFRPGRTTTGFIEARLKAGASVQDCRSIIARKVRAWKGDPKTQEWLRPKTLFNETNFAQYLGDIPIHTEEEAPDGMP